MNTHTIESSWNDTKAKIKTKWGKLTDGEVDGFKDNLDKISTQIQKTYGIAKDQAEREFNDFKKSLQAKPVVLAPVSAIPAKQADAMVAEGGKPPISQAV